MFEGFFTKKQTSSESRPDGKVYSCASCGMYKYVLHPRMKPYGNGKKGIMVIGEAPGEDEDRRGKPWQGKMGRALQKAYKELGIDLFEDCISINAVHCRPTDEKGNNRAPTGYEISCCRQRTMKLIRQFKPKVVILHGGTAIASIIGARWHRKLGGVNKWRGWAIPDRELQTWLCPTMHPSFIERQKGFDEIETIWKQDIRKAIGMINVPFPTFTPEEQQIELGECVPTLKRIREDLDILLSIGERPLLAFDLETTGLKPYDTNTHHIACVSFCYSNEKAYVIPEPKGKQAKALFKALLEDDRIGKIAANMKFEDTWVKTLYGIDVNYWLWDTMLASHVLDNRPGITSLKFQAYVHFGLAGYDDSVSQYLKGGDSPSETNRVLEAMEYKSTKERIMTYCGIDSLMTYKLAKKQMEEMGFTL